MLECRFYAMKETPVAGKAWAFYFVHESDQSIDKICVDEVIYTWGDWGSSQKCDICLEQVEPGKPVLLWRDDDDAAELNIDIIIQIVQRTGVEKIRFEFPKLYKIASFPCEASRA